MPVAIIGYILFAILFLGGMGFFSLVAMLILGVVYFIAMFGHELIRGMEKVMDGGGWVTSGIFYVFLYLPLLFLNWAAPLLTISWVGNHDSIGNLFSQGLGMSPWVAASVNRAVDGVLVPATHTVYGVLGAVTSPPSPEAFVTMLIADQVAALVLISATWVIVRLGVGTLIEMWRMRRSEGGAARDTASTDV